MAGKGFIKGENLSHALSKGDLGDQTVVKAGTARARFLQRPFGKAMGFHNYTVGAEDVLKGIEDTLFLPRSSEYPKEFGQNQERNEDAFCPAGCSNRRAGLLGLPGVIIEVGSRPDVRIGSLHQCFFRALAAFISSRLITRVGLGPASAIRHRSSMV